MEKDGVPDRWEDYCKIGTVVEGTNFIAFKVPLKQEILDKVSEGVDNKWSVDDVINAVPSPGLGLVIDLTFTTRYYDPNIFTSKEIEHKKILTKGHNIPNNALVEEFNETVDKSDGNKLIGVHCTHGLNRTGYLVCRYMIQKQGFQPEVAIAAFDDARGHKQERVNYLNHLKAKGWQGGGGGGGGFGGEERRGGGFDEFNVEEQLNYKAEETEQESIKAMEEEAEKLRQMQVEVDKQLAVPLSLTGNLNLSFEEKSVFICNVDYGATGEELEQHFHGCGSINRVTIPCNKYDGHPRGFAFVEFSDKDSVQTAMALDGSLFRGRKIKVMPKRTNKPGVSTTHRPPRGYRGGYRGGRGGFGAMRCPRFRRGGFGGGKPNANMEPMGAIKRPSSPSDSPICFKRSCLDERYQERVERDYGRDSSRYGRESGRHERGIKDTLYGRRYDTSRYDRECDREERSRCREDSSRFDRNDNKRSLRDRSRSRSRHFDHKQSRESRGERDTFEEHREPTKASSRYSLEVKRPQSPGSNRFQDSGYHKRRTEKYYSNESKISSRYCERSNDYEGRVRRDDSGTRDRHDTNKFKQERKESSSDSDSSWGDA